MYGWRVYLLLELREISTFVELKVNGMDFDIAMNKVFKTFTYPEVLFFKEEARMIYDAVKEMKAKRVMELGVGNGSSTIAFLSALEDTGGRLTSIDIVNNPWYDKRSPDKVKMAGLDKYWEFIQMNDLDYVKNCRDKFEIILVDTDHTYSQTWAEVNAFTHLLETGDGLKLTRDISQCKGIASTLGSEVNAFTPLLENGGTMYFHDTLHGEESIFVNKAVLDFIREQKAVGMNWMYTVFPTTCGMGKLIRT